MSQPPRFSPTDNKLAEARYFLAQLRTTEPHFDFLFSAFLNASRSVFWVMRHEFSERKGWAEWYAGSQVSAEEQALLQQMNALRVRSTKQAGVATNYLLLPGLAIDRDQYETAAALFDSLPPGTELKISLAEASDSEATSENISESEGGWRFQGFVQEDIDNETDPDRDRYLEWSRHYYAFLERKVRECISLFG